MRPDILFPLFADLTSLKGIGPRLGALLKKHTGGHVIDLLWHLPREVITRQAIEGLAMVENDSIITLNVTIARHQPPARPKYPYRVHCQAGADNLILIFFHGDPAYLLAQLPVGADRLISGRVEIYGSQYQIIHPDYILPVEKRGEIPTYEPVYALTSGVTSKVMRKAITGALARVPSLPEWLAAEDVKQRGWPSWHVAINTIHHPQGTTDLTPDAPARARLAYDELLANQLALAIMRRSGQAGPGRAVAGDGRYRDKLLAGLPFRLTGAQQKVIAEITDDMHNERAMLRLLQGDVGSGKTVVALIAALNAAEIGAQTALMVPTEILAQQHFATLQSLLQKGGLIGDEVNISVVVLTGRSKAKERRAALEKIADGSAQIIIGTHALFQADVVYNDLALCIIDEQHRFGVEQRMALASKGKAINMLVMTATPIPRSLMMSAYGDLDSSRLTEKPAHRQPIQTLVTRQDKMAQLLDGIKRKCQAGAKIYWVCPLVDDSAVLDLAAAEARYEDLQGIFGTDRVALVHGKMKTDEKETAMQNFINGPAQILVATTVIEVGVDVPTASVMVIEHAERFGLAQLHQLRGRIGRGEVASVCILLRAENIGEMARKRLKIMAQTNDGFVIAEQDLALRGAGEILGTRQSGLPELRLADLVAHTGLMQAATQDAKTILATDGRLKTKRGRAVRVLLYLFGRDRAVQNLKSG